MLKVRCKSRGLQALMQGLCCAAALAAGCNNTPPSDAISVDLVRSGAELAPTTFQYTDWKPSISDDGSKVVFISGRDSVGAVITSKAYKATWAPGKGPSVLTRVTTTDIGYEQDAQLSPDGNHVVLAVAKSGQTDLYLAPFDGSSSPVQITTDGGEKLGYQFSPDSTMVAWITRNSANATSQVQLVTLADAKTIVSLTKSDYAVQLFWMPVGAVTSTSYKLGVGSATALAPGMSVTYKQYDFTAGAAASATASAWFSGFNPKLSVAPAATATTTVVVEAITDPNAQTPQVGNGLVASPPLSAPISSSPAFVSNASSPTPTRYSFTPGTGDPAPGFDISSLSLTGDGATAFMIGHFFYRCANDPQDSFGSALVIAPTDPAKGYNFINPRLTAETGTPEEGYVENYDYAGLSFCDRTRADGNTSHIDDNLVSAVVNRNATAATYRVAYVTRATAHFDVGCNLLAGDPEVWLLDSTPTSHTFYPFSQNQSPLQDDPRPGQNGCDFY